MNREIGRKKEEEKREPVGMAKVFRFPNAVNSCHVQLRYSGRKHDSNN